MEDVSVTHRKLLDWLKLQSTIDKTYYAEIMGHMFLVNCPSLFTGLWSVAKSFVAPDALLKIHLYGTDRTEWGKELRKIVDPSNLPVYRLLCKYDILSYMSIF
jgi:hypothetical protein